MLSGNEIFNFFVSDHLNFQIFRKLTENSPRISRKIITNEKYFHEFYDFSKFSKNFETILPNVCFCFV